MQVSLFSIFIVLIQTQVQLKIKLVRYNIETHYFVKNYQKGIVMLVEIMKINKEDVTIVTCLDIAETFEKKGTQMY